MIIFVINDEIADCAARINDIVTDNDPELIGSDCKLIRLKMIF